MAWTMVGYSVDALDQKMAATLGVLRAGHWVVWLVCSRVV